MEQGVFAEMATAEEVGRRLSLGLVDGWMFKGLSVCLSISLYCCCLISCGVAHKTAKTALVFLYHNLPVIPLAYHVTTILMYTSSNL